MLHASTRNLIIKLCDLTEQGDIPWREGKSGAVEFETEGYVVEVAGAPPGLRVLKTEGDELEHASAETLAAVTWPEGDDTFADRVAAMAGRAQRIARGTEHAISRILSSLSAPPKAALVDAEDDPTGLDDSGVESEAAMAAAVADMALRLKRTPLDEPAPDVKPEPHAEPEAAPKETPGVRSLSTAGADRVVRSKEMFGRTRSFSTATGRSHHRPVQGARPVSSLGKITATGLMISGVHATTRQQVETGPEAPEPTEITSDTVVSAPPEPPRPPPEPASPDAYKPWS